MIIIPNWPVDEHGVQLGVCFMCQNRGVTWADVTKWCGRPSGYCGPCYRAGYYTFKEEGIE